MKTQNLKASLAAIVLIALVQVSFAQTGGKKVEASAAADKGNWVLLESRVVDYTLDRDVVALKGNPEHPELYTALKFKVSNGPINLHKCTVHFANGETQDIAFPTEPNDGSLVDLYGNTRAIEKITFWYNTKGSANKKATVEVWAKKSNSIN